MLKYVLNQILFNPIFLKVIKDIEQDGKTILDQQI